MPQMFPMNWLLLFSFIIFMFFITLVKLFFHPYLTTSNGSKNLLTTHSHEFKWMW